MRGGIVSALAVFLLASIFLFAGSVGANELSIRSRSGILMEVPSGKVLWEQNADTPIPPASITKIISLYLLDEAIEAGKIHPYDMVDVSLRAANTGGSRMGLRAGTKVPLEEIMKGMAVASGNDACVAAAEHLSGTVDEFVRLMNDKAQALGMTSTVFYNPNGLPARGQVTTARDIAKLSLAYLKRFPSALEIHSMRYYTYNKAAHHNCNRLLGNCDGVDGIKTGFVGASGYNISATAKRGNTRILAVVLGAPDPSTRLLDSGRLIEGGFEMLSPYDPGITFGSAEHLGEIFGRPATAAKRTSCNVTRSAKAKKPSTVKTAKSRSPKSAKAVESASSKGTKKSSAKQVSRLAENQSGKVKTTASKAGASAKSVAPKKKQGSESKEKKLSTRGTTLAGKKAAM